MRTIVASLDSRRHLPLALGATTALLLASGVLAYAFFTAPVSGNALATAATVGAGGQPSAVASGTSVTLNWPQKTLSNGAPVAGYVIKRYDANGVAQSVNAGCAGTIAALSCTESGVPGGTWTYTDTPTLNGWHGAESPRSAQVVVSSQGPTTTAVISSANPSLFGDMVTFTATVSPAPPAGESVTFSDGSATLGTGALNGAGIASFTTATALSLGDHAIHAVYPGDASFTTSTGSLTQHVTRVLVTPATAPANSPVTVRGAGWPAGHTIQVWLGSVGGTVLCYVTANSSGAFSTTCNLPTTLPHGTYPVIGTDGTVTDTGNQETITPAITSSYPAYANPTNTVTLSGAGYAANSALTVAVGTTPVTPSVTGTDASGQFNSLTFSVPAAAPVGATTITVTDTAGNSASISFTVYHASIAMSPTSQAANALVTVSGSGWPPNARSIQVWLGPVGGNGFVCYVGANGSGIISQTCPMPTRLPQGAYPLTGTDNSITATGNQQTMMAGITDFFPAYANPTNTVTLSGGGYAANSALTVTLGSTAVTPSISSTGSLGQFNGLMFTVPNGFAAGPTTVTVKDSATPANAASVAITIYNATVSMVSAGNTHTATSGSTVTVTGNGWPNLTPADSVTISILNVTQSGPLTLCSATVNTGGGFSTSCPLPTSIPAGSYPVQATDGSITATDPIQFTVTPAISLNPTSGPAGTTSVTITGSGFAPNSAIHVSFNGVAVPITSGSTSSDANGRVLNTVFTVPSGTAAGTYTVTATDSATPTADSGSAPFTVT